MSLWKMVRTVLIFSNPREHLAGRMSRAESSKEESGKFRELYHHTELEDEEVFKKPRAKVVSGL